MAFNMWENPMERAYRDVQFNRYSEGPGSELPSKLQPGAINSKNKQNCALYLKNIPSEMNMAGVKRFCDSMATVVDVKLYTGTALVIFNSSACAEHALQILNQDNKIGIRASFAHSKSKDIESDDNSSHMQNRSNNHHNNNFDRNMDTSHTPPNQLRQHANHFNNRQVQGPFSNPVKIHQKTKYSQDTSSISSNDYNTNYRFSQVDRNGDFRNQQNFKRGENAYLQDRLNKFRNTEESMKRLTISQGGHYSKSESGGFVKPQVGPCVLCSKPTDKQCEKCKDFYCSVECQHEDWPNHRKLCLIPKLVSTNAQSAQPQNRNRIENDNHRFNQQKRNSHDTNNRKGNSQSSDSDQSNISTKRERDNFKNKQNLSPNNKSDSESQISSKSNEKLLNKSPSTISPSTRNENNISNKNLNESNNKMSLSVQLKATDTEISQSEFPKNQAIVAITAVNDHRTIYIRSMDTDANCDYIKILQDCSVYEKNYAKPLTELPKKGDIVLAEFEGIYYRALVLKVTNETNINVAYIDFGNKAKRSIEMLKCLSNDLQTRTRYTHKIQLNGIPKQMTNDKVMEFLNPLPDTQKLYKLLHIDVGSDGVATKTYELIETESNESINKRICQLNMVVPVSLTDTPIFGSDIKYKGIVGENLDLIILSNCLAAVNSFSCILKSDINVLRENDQKFQEYCKSVHEKYTPRCDELCLVYLDDEKSWYRGQCIEVAGDGFPSIMFVDYGNINNIKIENIRKIPQEFCYRCVTSECSVAGLPKDVPIGMLKRLNEIFAEGAEISVKKADLVDNTDNRSSELHLSRDIMKKIFDN